MNSRVCFNLIKILLVRAIRYAIERKKAEMALAAEKELLDVTLRSIGDALIPR